MNKDVEKPADVIIYMEYEALFVIQNDNEIFEKAYQDVYTESYDKVRYYKVLIYWLHAENDNSVKKIMILSNHLLIYIVERKYRDMDLQEKETILSVYLHIICLTLPDNVKISRRSVKNGLSIFLISIHYVFVKNPW